MSRLRRHPRVEYQNLVCDDSALDRMRASSPYLVPFAGNRYAGLLPLLDWDHRLPSSATILRIYAFYGDEKYRTGLAEFEARRIRIQGMSKFPEFDVPDFSAMAADEAYEADVSPDGQVSRPRLVSPWRREIEAEASRAAVTAARKSAEFSALRAEHRARPQYLGDLEAVSWTPPCECDDIDIWTIDCWYLLHLDNSVGKGRSFLVDPDRNAVIGVREFVVRSG